MFTWVTVSPWAPFHGFPLFGYLSAVVIASFFSSGRFWLTLLCYLFPLHGVTTVVSLGFVSYLRSWHLFCPGLVRDLGVSRLCSTLHGYCLPWAFWHQMTSHRFSGSPSAGHPPPKGNLLILFFGKYLSEQMVFLSC